MHGFLRRAIFTCSHAILLQKERDRLLAEVENLAANSDGQTQKLQDIHAHKLKSLESQVKINLSLINAISFGRYSS